MNLKNETGSIWGRRWFERSVPEVIDPEKIPTKEVIVWWFESLEEWDHEGPNKLDLRINRKRREEK